MSAEEQSTPSELKWIDTATQLLDNRFRIPGTDIRFGLDFLIGLMPGIGDIFSLGISGLLVVVRAPRILATLVESFRHDVVPNDRHIVVFPCV